MTNFLLIFFCLGIGIILQRKQDIDTKAMSHALNQYVIFVALPALVLAKMPFLQFSSDLIIPIVMPYLMLCFGAAMVLTAAKACKWSKGITGCLLLCVPLGNTSFLGIPMITAFFGEELVKYGIVYDQLGSFIALATFGTFVLAKYQQNHQATGFAVFKKIITFPAFIALMASMLLRFLPYPPALVSCFDHIGDSLVPVVMVAVGLQLKIRLPGRYVAPFFLGLAVKLILAPLLALALAAGFAPELAAALVGWGILLSFFTLTGLYFLL